MMKSISVLDAQWPQFVQQMILPDGHPQIRSLQAQILQLT